MVSRGKCILGFFTSIWLAACTTVPLASIVKLSAVDLSHTPPDQFRVAFIVPEMLKVRPGDMVMKVHLKLADGSFDSTRSLVLLEDDSPPPASVKSMTGPGQAVHIMKLEQADTEAYRKLQDVFSANQEPGKHKKGSLDINFSSQACATGPIKGPMLVSAAIKTAELADYTILFSNLDLIDMAKQAGEKAEVKPCV